MSGYADDRRPYTPAELAKVRRDREPRLATPHEMRLLATIDALRLQLVGARSATARLLDDYVPDVEHRGWWHIGSGMAGPGEPMTPAEHRWLLAAEAPPSTAAPAGPGEDGSTTAAHPHTPEVPR